MKKRGENHQNVNEKNDFVWIGKVCLHIVVCFVLFVWFSCRLEPPAKNCLRHRVFSKRRERLCSLSLPLTKTRARSLSQIKHATHIYTHTSSSQFYFWHWWFLALKAAAASTARQRRGAAGVNSACLPMSPFPSPSLSAQPPSTFRVHAKNTQKVSFAIIL